MWKENRFGCRFGHHLVQQAICAVIALLAGYVQKARSLEKVSHRCGDGNFSPLVMVREGRFKPRFCSRLILL